jgi:hypothetical protein
MSLRVARSFATLMLAVNVVMVPLEHAEARHSPNRKPPRPKNVSSAGVRTCFDNRYGDHFCQGDEHTCQPYSDAAH